MATGKPRSDSCAKGSLFVTAGGFHGHQFYVMVMTEGGQRGDALGAVGKCGFGSVLSDARSQR